MSDKRDRSVGGSPSGRRVSVAPTQRRYSEAPIPENRSDDAQGLDDMLESFSRSPQVAPKEASKKRRSSVAPAAARRASIAPDHARRRSVAQRPTSEDGPRPNKKRRPSQAPDPKVLPKTSVEETLSKSSDGKSLGTKSSEKRTDSKPLLTPLPDTRQDTGTDRRPSDTMSQEDMTPGKKTPKAKRPRRRSTKEKSPGSESSEDAPSKPTAGKPQDAPHGTYPAQRSDLSEIHESPSDVSTKMPRDRQVSIAPAPPLPSSASSSPPSPETSRTVPMQPAALTANATEESPPPSRRNSTLPRAPKRQRSDDVSVIIPPPVPGFRKTSDASEDSRKTSSRRSSLLSWQARRSSGTPPPPHPSTSQNDQSSERRSSSIKDRLRSLTKTDSPPTRDQVVVRRLNSDEEDRRSTIVDSYYGLDQPLSPGHIIFVGLALVALTMTYGFKLDLPYALERMTDHHVASDVDTRAAFPLQMGLCPDGGSSMYPKDGPFRWDSATHRMLIRAFHLGYMFSGIPGAVLAEKCSAKWVIVSGGCCLFVGAMFFPIISVFDVRFSAEVLVFLLLLQGLGAGVMLPAITTLLSKWTTRRHRSIYAGIVYGGLWLGPVCAELVNQIALNMRWQFVYHYMVLGIIPWLLITSFWLGEDTSIRDRCVPLRDHMIVVAEQANIRSYDITLGFPFNEVVNSVPFWALLIMHFSGNLAFYTVNYLMPLYMREVLRFNVNEVGDNYDVHCVGNCAVSGHVLLCITCLSFVQCNSSVASGIYLVAVCGIGAQTVGWIANHLDLAPNFAGPLMAITNTAATIPYVFWPTLVALITEGFPENVIRERWGMVFQSTAGIYLISFLFYCFGGTAVIQKWNAGRIIV